MLMFYTYSFNKVSLFKGVKKRIKTPINTSEINFQSKYLRDVKLLTFSNFCKVNIDVRFYSDTFRRL